MFGVKKEKEKEKEREREIPAPAPVVEEPEAPVIVEEPVVKKPEPVKPRTLIGPGIRFVGDIEATEDIEINGSVEGNITSGNTITVTEEASIKGAITAQNFILLGQAEGPAKIADFCRIGENGRFTGELSAATLVTEDGSRFDGVLHLGKPLVAAAVPVVQETVQETTPLEEELFGAAAVQEEPAPAEAPYQEQPVSEELPPQEEPAPAEPAYQEEPAPAEPVYAAEPAPAEPVYQGEPAPAEPVYQEEPAPAEPVYQEEPVREEVPVQPEEAPAEMPAQTGDIPAEILAQIEGLSLPPQDELPEKQPPQEVQLHVPGPESEFLPILEEELFQ